MKLLHEDITEKILKAYYEVYNTLGFGFLEKVYENALIVELQSLGLKCEQQKPIDVYYKTVRVGEYFADIVVEDRVIVELKASKIIADEHEFQLTNYLKATTIEGGASIEFRKDARIQEENLHELNLKRKSVSKSA